MGRGLGFKPNSIDDTHEHLVHGMTVGVLWKWGREICMMPDF
jgi:hypothetical protein